MNALIEAGAEQNIFRTAALGDVERGPSLTAVNKNGENALDMAIKNDKKSIAAYLRGMGATPAR